MTISANCFNALSKRQNLNSNDQQESIMIALAMMQRPRILPPSARAAFAHRQCHPCTLTCSPIAVQQTLHVNVQPYPCPTSLLYRQCVLHVDVQRPSPKTRAARHVNVQSTTGREPPHVNVQARLGRPALHVDVQALPCPTSLLNRQCVLHVDVQRPSPKSRTALHVNVQNMIGRESLHVNVQGHSERRKDSMHVNVRGPLDTGLKGRPGIQPHQNRTDKDLGPGKPPGPKSLWRPEMN